MRSVKICGFNVKVCWILFIILNILTIVFMIAILGVDKWVKMEDEDTDVQYEGSIWRLHKTKGFMKQWDDKNYMDLANDWCDLEDDVPSESERKNTYEAGCTLFTLMATCCTVYWVFEMCSLLYTIMNILGFVLYLCQKDFIWVSLISVVAQNIWNALAFIAYNGALRLDFKGQCDDFRENDRFQPMCADEGPELGLFLILFMAIYGVFQCLFIGCYYVNRKKEKNDQGQEMQHHQA